MQNVYMLAFTIVSVNSSFFTVLFFCICVMCQPTAGDLMIRNIQLKHAGKYVCVVDTDVESLSVAAVLVVKGEQDVSLPSLLQVPRIYDPTKPDMQC